MGPRLAPNPTAVVSQAGDLGLSRRLRGSVKGERPVEIESAWTPALAKVGDRAVPVLRGGPRGSGASASSGPFPCLSELWGAGISPGAGDGGCTVACGCFAGESGLKEATEAGGFTPSGGLRPVTTTFIHTVFHTPTQKKTTGRPEVETK